VTELATTDSTALEPLSAEEEALVASVKGKFDRKDMILPQIRLAAGLSRSVQDGDAKPGDFVNTLTGENYGTEFDLVIVDYFKGRLFTDEDKTNDTYVTMDEIAPDNWPAQYAGQPFVDIPDAEEQYREWANQEGNDWGDGPKIATTHNYVGFIADEDALEIPVRLSLKKTSTPTARKINTLLDVSRAPWDKVFHVESVSREAKGFKFHIVDAKIARASDREERTKAVELATALQNATNVKLHGDGPEEKVAPESREGALDT
jgi:hypothetical protein